MSNVDNMVIVKMKYGESVTQYQKLINMLMTSYQNITNSWPTVGQLLVCALTKTCGLSVGQQPTDC